jgi:hypothetical protein
MGVVDYIEPVEVENFYVFVAVVAVAVVVVLV